MSTPAVSVVMAVHNRADYLPEAIASLRWQTFTDWECVCVDDGSTDASPQILAEFAAVDPRFRIVRQENAGVAAALARGDAEARGDWIARMDSDDVALPQRLERQWNYVTNHPDCVGLGGEVLLVDPDGAPLGRQRYATEHDEIERRLLSGSGVTIAHPTLFFRRDAIRAVGSYRPECPVAVDFDFLLRLVRFGRLTNLEEVLLLYRQHPGNLCRQRFQQRRTQMLRSLREAYAARGRELPAEVAALADASFKQTPLVGKWARQAARHGNVGTATKLLRQLIREHSVSPYTIRVAAEVTLRSAVALMTGKRDAPLDLPDWREWDCRSDAVGKLSAA